MNKRVSTKGMYQLRYPDLPLCPKCYVQHQGHCPQFERIVGQRCVCTFKTSSFTCPNPGNALLHLRKVDEGNGET